MKYTVVLSHRAFADLDGIYDYIAAGLQSTQNAAAQLARLEEQIYALDHMPERYRRYEKEPWYSRGWRIMPVDRYCVIYMPDHEKKIVHIIRVLYGGRDMEKALAGGPLCDHCD